MKKTLGGDRLGAGKKMQVNLHNYGRSSHNLSRIWRSSMTQGTLVPFLVEPILLGDTFDVDLETLVRTLPTNGPVFGSFKQQLDLFLCPMRLYIAELHNDKIGVGMKMANVKLPMMELNGPNPQVDGGEMNQQQINPSSLLAYLGIRGLGKSVGTDVANTVKRNMQAATLLAYWDIYKNYYANKQEGIGVVMDTIGQEYTDVTITQLVVMSGSTIKHVIEAADLEGTETTKVYQIGLNDTLLFKGTNLDKMSQLYISASPYASGDSPIQKELLGKPGINVEYGDSNSLMVVTNAGGGTGSWFYATSNPDTQLITIDPAEEISQLPGLTTFDLETIDEMREELLQQPAGTTVVINELEAGSKVPYTSTYGLTSVLDPKEMKAKTALAGLGVKTYLSDRFNNWLETEWIDGPNGIAAISAVDTSSGSFTMDSLNLAQKVYNMLNRIAVSGGSYQDWLEATTGEYAMRRAESPMYMGGMSSEIVFNEVVSTAESTDQTGGAQPLGSLAGRGKDTGQKGGTIRIKAQEHSFIIGIVSYTPRVDYSQGNKWFNRAETMDDWHKPALDGIGFQELITDEMAAWDTSVTDGTPTYKSAGKQPAWIEYMTSQNECYGTFAENDKEMFMTLTRRYDANENRNIADLTTYIDPSKYNYAFAVADNTAQNFWTQIGVKITARRKMSAKMIPNL